MTTLLPGLAVAWILEELKAAGKISGYDAHTINISAGDQVSCAAPARLASPRHGPCACAA